jgi:succinoglycan biosynthesis protein ExoW
MNETGTAPPSRKTSVVIPYYQEEPGILRGAVLSAIAQEGVTDLEIVVVDDGSPAPARDDLRDLDIPAHITLKLIEQSNRGPGAARNRGLDNVSSDTVHVAFLDSDDQWRPGHLRDAINVLAGDLDFYCANAWSSRSQRDFFSDREFDVHSHLGISGKPHAYRVSGDIRLRLVNERSFIHTSTVVYAYRRFAHLRFPEAYWLGEDICFWVDLAVRTDRFAVSSSLACNSGPGIHIYDSCGWGTSKVIWGLCENVKWRKDMQRKLAHQREITNANQRRMNEIRAAFVAAALNDVRSGRGLTYDAFRFIKEDWSSLLYLIPVTTNLILSKVWPD